MSLKICKTWCKIVMIGHLLPHGKHFQGLKVLQVGEGQAKVCSHHVKPFHYLPYPMVENALL